MKVSVVVEDDSGHKFHGEVELKPQRKSGKSAHSPKAVARASVKGVSAPAAVRVLWEKGKFKTAQTFGEIERELGELEYNFPKNTLTMALGSAAYLTRRGARGSYRWIQKYKAGA
jgi:hypothetical protein